MTQYEVRFQLPPAMLEAAMRSFGAPDTQEKPKRKNPVFGLLLWVALFIATFLLFNLEIIVISSDLFDLFDLTVVLFTVLGFCAGFLVVDRIYKGQMRTIVKTAQDAAARQGPVHMVLRPEQVTVSSRLSETTMDWRSVDRIVRLPDATVLQLGGGVTAVPDSALPEGVTPEQFHNDVTKWLEAAQ
ncbi:hypothetical protein [uncultured Sulfitobacter sp.]|uniref:hypothetical protein n=1 Tax=uncultured Sulfitobacter sp. TaxID=191468 RepID=UPI00262D7087|nr:hypothetical protein [uncultured Sulfitobacter sp.]